jgi:hypothetical protein
MRFFDISTNVSHVLKAEVFPSTCRWPDTATREVLSRWKRDW